MRYLVTVRCACGVRRTGVVNAATAGAAKHLFLRSTDDVWPSGTKVMVKKEGKA